MQSRGLEEPQLPRRTRLRFWLRCLHYEFSTYRTGQRRKSLAVNIVLIAVITGLIALILYPAFVTPSHGSHHSCMSNQRQIALGFLMYAQDNDDYLPHASAWMDATNAYVKSASIYRCPIYYTEKQGVYGYAFNSELAALQIKSKSHPETLPLVYDSDALGHNATAIGRSGLANPPRHNGKNIMAFLDGHVHAVDAQGVPWPPPTP